MLHKYGPQDSQVLSNSGFGHPDRRDVQRVAAGGQRQPLTECLLRQRATQRRHRTDPLRARQVRENHPCERLPKSNNNASRSDPEHSRSRLPEENPPSTKQSAR